MARLINILVIVLVLYAILVGFFPAARTAASHLDLARRLGFYGVLTLGAGTLIIVGGIDLSIGSLVGLGAVTFGLLVQKEIVSPAVAALAVIAAASVVGLFHGLLVTRLHIQPFLVTLCGLFIYRGVARTLTQTTVGLRVADDALQRQADDFANLLVRGTTLGVPHVLLVMLGLAAALGLFLHGSVFGRRLFATGANDQAARYAGIATRRYKVLAYMICSACAGLGGVLYLCEYTTATPSNAGALLELYAITGAVLGGCALRGGEGTVPGLVLGTAVLPILSKICNFSPYIGSDYEYTVIGVALLTGTIVNQLLSRKSR